MVLCEAKTPPYLASFSVSLVQFSNCPQLFSRKLSFYGFRKREKYPFCLFRAGGWQRMGISGFFLSFPLLVLGSCWKKSHNWNFLYLKKKELETRKKNTLWGFMKHYRRNYQKIILEMKLQKLKWKRKKSYTRRSLRKTSIAKLL